MVIKEYSTFPRSSDLKPHHQIIYLTSSKNIDGGGVLPYYRYNQHILQPTAPYNWAEWICVYVYEYIYISECTSEYIYEYI